MKLAGRPTAADTPFPQVGSGRAGAGGEDSGAAGCGFRASLCHCLRHRGKRPAPRRDRRSPAGASAPASPPSAGSKPCVPAGRTMPRQLLSGTVLLGAALLLAGKGPLVRAALLRPRCAPSSPRRPPGMCLVGCASRAPDRPRRAPLVCWSRRAPASASLPSSGQGRGSDPGFPGSGETPHPRAVAILRIPVGVPREQLPGGPGGAEPRCPSWSRQGSAGREANLSRAQGTAAHLGSCPNRCSTERGHILAAGHASFLRTSFSCVPALPVKRQRCSFAKLEVPLPPARAGRRSAGGRRLLLESGMELLSGAYIPQCCGYRDGSLQIWCS